MNPLRLNVRGDARFTMIVPQAGSDNIRYARNVSPDTDQKDVDSGKSGASAVQDILDDYATNPPLAATNEPLVVRVRSSQFRYGTLAINGNLFPSNTKIIIEGEERGGVVFENIGAEAEALSVVNVGAGATALEVIFKNIIFVNQKTSGGQSCVFARVTEAVDSTVCFHNCEFLSVGSDGASNKPFSLTDLASTGGALRVFVEGGCLNTIVSGYDDAGSAGPSAILVQPRSRLAFKNVTFKPTDVVNPTFTYEIYDGAVVELDNCEFDNVSSRMLRIQGDPLDTTIGTVCLLNKLIQDETGGAIDPPVEIISGGGLASPRVKVPGQSKKTITVDLGISPALYLIDAFPDTTLGGQEGAILASATIVSSTGTGAGAPATTITVEDGVGTDFTTPIDLSVTTLAAEVVTDMTIFEAGKGRNVARGDIIYVAIAGPVRANEEVTIVLRYAPVFFEEVI